ncbi:MAG: hypothetical protein AAF404_09495, partial [Pseudomonadota bacterium]
MGKCVRTLQTTFLVGVICMALHTQAVLSVELPESPATNELSAVQGAVPEQLVALDLVRALKQITPVSAETLRFSMLVATDAFGANLRQTLEMVGYTMVSASTAPAAQRIDYVIKDKYTDRGLVKTYQIQAGPVKLRRDYLIIENSVQPASTLYVQGADATAIALNDEIFSLDKVAAAPAPDSAASQQTLPRDTLPQINLTTVDKAMSYRVGRQIVVAVAADRETRLYCYYQD